MKVTLRHEDEDRVELRGGLGFWRLRIQTEETVHEFIAKDIVGFGRMSADDLARWLNRCFVELRVEALV